MKIIKQIISMLTTIAIVLTCIPSEIIYAQASVQEVGEEQGGVQEHQVGQEDDTGLIDGDVAKDRPRAVEMKQAKAEAVQKNIDADEKVPPKAGTHAGRGVKGESQVARGVSDSAGTKDMMDAVSEKEPHTDSPKGIHFTSVFPVRAGQKRTRSPFVILPLLSFNVDEHSEETSYHVIFNNGGTLSEPLLVEVGEHVKEPSSPVKIGYIFEGWYTAEENGRLWDFAQDVMPASDLTLYALYTLRSYAVQFINERVAGEVFIVEFGSLITEPISPEKVGYTFEGWYTGLSSGKKWDFALDTMPAYTLLLYARYSINSYQVRFDNDGDVSEPISVNYKGGIPEPEAPEKLGHIFKGWYTEAEGGHKWLFKYDSMPANDLTLYAYYWENIYRLFIYDDEHSLMERKVMAYGELIPKPADPTRIGRTFIGWYTAPEGGRQVDFTKDTMPAHEWSIYARYTANSYQVRFDNEGKVSEPLSVDYKSLITEPLAPEKIGFTFLGWYTQPKFGQAWNFTKDTMPADDVILYAQYQVNSYSVFFDVEGRLSTGYSTKFGERVRELPRPEKYGFTFTGWYTAPEGGRKWDFVVDTMPAGDVILYAQFVVKNYSIWFRNDGVLSEPISVPFKALVPEPTPPEKLGHTFIGWEAATSHGGMWIFSQDRMPARDLIFTATYTANKYIMLYDVGDGIIGPPIMREFGLPLYDLKPRNKVGHTFIGWYTAPEGGRKWDFELETMPAHDLTLYAHFVPNTYTVRFNNDRVVSDPLIVEFGANITEPVAPEKAGYTFIGWYTAAAGGRKWDFAVDTMPAHDLMLFAMYTSDTGYAVRFNNAGEVSEPMAVLEGEHIPVPKTPEKLGHTFVGWYTAAAGGRKWDFAIDMMPAHDLMLHARYNVNSYNLSFNNEGIVDPPYSVKFGVRILEPMKPVKPGYEFIGWYSAPTGGRKWNFAIDTMPANDMTLYARYGLNEYAVIFNNEGVVTEPIFVRVGLMIDEPRQPMKEGYTFVGWYTDAINGRQWLFAEDMMPSHNITLYARYNINSYNVRFNNDGIVNGPFKIIFGERIIELAAASKEGYTFAGWYTDALNGRQWLFAEDMMPAHDITLYARYNINSYNLSFNNDGIVNGPYHINFNERIIEPAPGSKEGYVFDGWYTAAVGGRKWDFAIDTMPANDLTLFARYASNTTYTVRFDNEGKVSEPLSVSTGARILEPKTPEKVGYTFIGWYTAAVGGRKWDFAIDTMPANDLTLFARYVPNTSYTVRFNNEGEVSEPLSVSTGARISEPKPPEKVGYTFIGWYTAAVGGRKWDFAIDTMPANDLTLFARYVPNTSYTVRFDNEGKVSEPMSINTGGRIPEPKTPEKVGYTFVGWYTDAIKGRQWIFAEDVMPAHNMTLYARYNINSYNVRFSNEGIVNGPYHINFNEKMIEPAVGSKEGYTFVGWYTAATGGRKWDFNVDTMPAYDLILYARYAVNSYNVSFNNEGVIAGISVNFGQLITEPMQPVKVGYSFLGWYTEPTGGRPWNFAIERMPAHDMMLYAQYVENQYAVFFNNEGRVTGPEFLKTGEYLTEPTKPVKPGYKFIGWYTELEDGRAWDFERDTMPARDIMLYARYEKI
jgi:uncharacterized repeat protein (TIGR02543 family)